MKRVMLTGILVCLLLSGCYDMREINEIGLVMEVGIDKLSDGTEGFEVTVQIANPKQGSGKQGGSEGGVSKSWVCSGTGATIFEAVRELSKVASKRVMWAHNNIVIVGEELAKSNITPVLDFFTHNTELRMKTWIVVSHGKAKDYLKAKIVSGELAGLEVSNLFRYQKLVANSAASEILHVYSSFKQENSHPLMSGLLLTESENKSGEKSSEGPEKQLKLSGSAVFKGSKMLGWLTDEETRGINWVLENTENTIVSVRTKEATNYNVAIETRKVKSKINSTIVSGVPHFTIDISGTGDIVEEDGTTEKSMPEYKAELEILLNKRIKNEIMLGLSKIQKDYKSDVVDFAQIFHIQNPKEWRKKYRTQWEEVFPEIPVEVNVNIDINSSILNQIPAK